MMVNAEFDNNNNYNINKDLKPTKKNRTLQFYTFLFYSIKLEIKVHEFVDLVRFANQSEIILWILSFLLYINTPKNFPKISSGETKVKYKNVFIWLHVFHLIRAGFGIYIWIKIPKSYHYIESMKNYSDEKLSKTLFNDLARENLDHQIIKPIKDLKILIFIYFSLTFINLIFDIIDFLIILPGLKEASSDSKVVLLSYLMIAFCYISVDLYYAFWGRMLKYHFPARYYAPISNAFYGTVDKALIRFKIKKPKTDVIAEEQAQNNANKENEKSQANNYNINNDNTNNNDFVVNL